MSATSTPANVEASIRRRLDKGDWVDISPLRQAFEESGIGTVELARRLGWMKPDAARVNQVLGLKSEKSYVSRENAERIAEELGLDPVEAGF